MTDRKYAKRSITIEVHPDERPKAAPRTLRERLHKFVHGDQSITYLNVKLDGEDCGTVYPHNSSDRWLYLTLDDKSHTLSLHNPALKGNSPSVTIPRGTDSLVYTADGAEGYRIVLSETVPAVPAANLRTAAVTNAIAAFLLDELSPDGESCRKLRSRQAWSMWLECWEEGFHLGYFVNETRSVRKFTYASFRRSPDDYKTLCIADAIALEHLLMEQVKNALPKDLKVTYEDGYYIVECPVDVMGCTTTWELRSILLEAWQESGPRYRDLHEYDVYRAILSFSERAVSIYYEGYGNERKPLPPDVQILYADLAQGAARRYTILNGDESATLEDFLTRELDDNCKRIDVTHMPNYPHTYYINDLRKLHYQGQEPYWTD